MTTNIVSPVPETTAPNTAAPAVPETTEAAPRSVDWHNPRVAARLTAAAKCFSRRGGSATTLAEIGKEVGRRKSIVHYYFASKAALIHEVQSFTYNQYLERVRSALDNGQSRTLQTMRAMWAARTTSDVGLNIEVWSASQNDTELRRRASVLNQEKRKLVAEAVVGALGEKGVAHLGGLEPACTLILAVLNGLSVADYIEGPEVQADAAYESFLRLLGGVVTAAEA